MKRKINKLFILFSILVFVSCRTIRTVAYDIEEARVSSEIRIVQISDFHSNDFGKNENTIIEKIKKARPDIIAITGDLFDEKMKGDKPFKNVEALLAGIRDLCPGFFVTGNHDFSDLHIEKKYAMVERYGFKVLHDEAVALDFPQGTVVIAGVEDPYFGLGDRAALRVGDDRASYRTRLAAVAQKTDALVRSIADESEKTVLFTMLLVHRPEYVKRDLSGTRARRAVALSALYKRSLCAGTGYVSEICGREVHFEKRYGDGREPRAFVSAAESRSDLQ